MVAVEPCSGEADQARGACLSTRAWALDRPPALFSTRPRRIGGISLNVQARPETIQGRGAGASVLPGGGLGQARCVRHRWERQRTGGDGRAGGRREGARHFSNTAGGHQQLRDYLAAPGRPVRVCLEATGLYGLDVALGLERDARFQGMVANPRAVKNFAQALFQRSKNDRRDAGVLLEYAARMPFQAWQPPSRAALQLTAVTRRLQTLTEQARAEKNRGHALAATAASSTVVVGDVKRSLRAIEKAQARLARAAEKIIADDEPLGELVLVPANADVRQWVAYAGLDPREYSSGSSWKKRTRISKVGNRHVRRVLYMPALTAAHHSPVFRAYYQHLLAAGKCKMVALIAVMRKLLHAVFGMFKHNAAFDETKVYPGFPPELAASFAS
jgi:transposase